MENQNSLANSTIFASSEALKLRWISVQCYEMVLPNGKVIVTDPFYWEGENIADPKALSEEDQKFYQVYKQTGFSVDDFTGADYILITHIHGDHVNIVGKLWEKFHGRILVSAGAAEELARIFNIPFGALYPLYPGNTYYFDDFTLNTYPAAHDSRQFRLGNFMRPDDPEDGKKGSDIFGMPYPNKSWGYGYLYCMNFMITTLQNYRIDISSGMDFEEHARHMMDVHPNLMLRHRIRSYSPEVYAQQMERMGAQLMMPLHHNNARASGEDLDAYFAAVNEVLKSHHYPGCAFNPVPYKWYSIQTAILEA